MKRVTATVLSGFLSAGETRVLNPVLANRKRMRITVIVKEISEVNSDAQLVANGKTGLSRTERRQIEVTNGSICCTLRDDSFRELSRFPLEKRFDIHKAESLRGWVKESMKEHVPETEVYEIGSAAYGGRRPFHSVRLWQATRNQWPAVAGSKGFFCLNTQRDWIGELCLAGESCRYFHAGTWRCETFDKASRDDEKARRRIQVKIKGPSGERRHEIVLIGTGIERAGQTAMLDAALLAEKEFSAVSETRVRNVDFFVSAARPLGGSPEASALVGEA